MARHWTIVLVAVLCAAAFSPCSWAQEQPAAEIIFDQSHEFPDAAYVLTGVLAKVGIGMVQSEASLTSIADRLAPPRVLLLWQEATQVPYTAEEVKLIKGFVGQGGIVILVGNVDSWVKRNGGRPADYPLLRLAAALGMPPGDSDRQQPSGKGRLVYFHNRGVLSYASLEAESRTGPGQGARLFQSVMTGLRPALPPRNEVIPPDGSFKVGSVGVVYPANLSDRALLVQKWLPPLDAALQKIYVCPLEANAQCKAMAYTGTVWNRFGLNLWAGPDTVSMDLARQLALHWYYPGGHQVNLPAWVSIAWTDAVAARACTVSGVNPNALNLFRILDREYRATDPKGNQIDLSVASNPWAPAYRGKAVQVLELLEKEGGVNVIARLRKVVRVYQAAGKIKDNENLDTSETVHLLSLAVGRDLTPFFKSIGTTVEAKPLDLVEFRNLEKMTDELLAAPTAP